MPAQATATGIRGFRQGSAKRFVTNDLRLAGVIERDVDAGHEESGLAAVHVMRCLGSFPVAPGIGEELGFAPLPGIP